MVLWILLSLDEVINTSLIHIDLLRVLLLLLLIILTEEDIFSVARFCHIIMVHNTLLCPRLYLNNLRGGSLIICKVALIEFYECDGCKII